MPAKPPPATTETIPPKELAKAAVDMRRALDEEIELGDFGFGVSNARHKTPEQCDEELRRNRVAIQNPKSLAAFIATGQWLSQFRKLKSLNKRGGSYGLKHRAERDIGYITQHVYSLCPLRRA